MVDVSDVALVGPIVGASNGYPVYGETDSDHYYRGGYLVEVGDLLFGKLDSDAETVRIDTFASEHPLSAADLKAATDQAPKGDLVWFLRSIHNMIERDMPSDYPHPEMLEQSLDTYVPAGLVQGVFMQGPNGVIAAFDALRDQYASGEVARRFPTLSSLTDATTDATS